MGKPFILKKIYAHCDIPCGIYDPHTAQIAALTVLRMLGLLSENKDVHDVARYVAVKEEHAERCKNEIRIIWGDFFKGEDLTPETNSLVHEIMELASEAKQGHEKKLGEDLVEVVNRFAEVFWSKQGIETKRVAAPYKVDAQIVVPKL